jgi:hypothetical protein
MKTQEAVPKVPVTAGSQASIPEIVALMVRHRTSAKSFRVTAGQCVVQVVARDVCRWCRRQSAQIVAAYIFGSLWLGRSTQVNPRTGAMNMRDVVAAVIAAIVLGLVFFATMRLEQPRPKVTVEQTK